MPSRASYHFAFYVSGHGYGHCTRASALITTLLSSGHRVTIVTNASSQPFSSVLPPSSIPIPAAEPLEEVPHKYAAYRQAPIDAGIVQPKAYDVDRKATYDGLKAFMDAREERMAIESQWLKKAGVDAVLSDATFMGPAAARLASIPAILVSNFTFDSCYSYLSHPALPTPSDPSPEPPLPSSLLTPLIKTVTSDYNACSLLLRLPGAIPIPAFSPPGTLPLESGEWINATYDSFTQTILDHLPSPTPNPEQTIIDVPMIVRPPSSSIYDAEARATLLNTIGVPESQHNKKILLVSFGGQSIPRPRSRPPSPSIPSSPSLSPKLGSNSLAPEREAGLLPPGWIAIVCGLGAANGIRDDLPDGFYASQSDVYVPDLTATSDVVLGKLGYGTCSEVVSTRTGFIYVPRPLFVEEFGLSRFMKSVASECPSIELSRSDFEGGRWEHHIARVYELSKAGKEEARKGFKENGAAEIIKTEIEKFLEKRVAK